MSVSQSVEADSVGGKKRTQMQTHWRNELWFHKRRAVYYDWLNMNAKEGKKQTGWKLTWNLKWEITK